MIRDISLVPVVAALPVIFIDQYGESEDPKRNRFGETHNFRGLLAPQNGAWSGAIASGEGGPAADGSNRPHGFARCSAGGDRRRGASRNRPKGETAARLCAARGAVGDRRRRGFRSGRLVGASLARRGGNSALAARTAAVWPNSGRGRQQSGGDFKVFSLKSAPATFVERLFSASANRAARHRRFAPRADVFQSGRANRRQSGDR